MQHLAAAAGGGGTTPTAAAAAAAAANGSPSLRADVSRADVSIHMDSVREEEEETRQASAGPPPLSCGSGSGRLLNPIHIHVPARRRWRPLPRRWSRAASHNRPRTDPVLEATAEHTNTVSMPCRNTLFQFLPSCVGMGWCFLFIPIPASPLPRSLHTASSAKVHSGDPSTTHKQPEPIFLFRRKGILLPRDNPILFHIAVMRRRVVVMVRNLDRSRM